MSKMLRMQMGGVKYVNAQEKSAKNKTNGAVSI